MIIIAPHPCKEALLKSAASHRQQCPPLPFSMSFAYSFFPPGRSDLVPSQRSSHGACLPSTSFVDPPPLLPRTYFVVVVVSVDKSRKDLWKLSEEWVSAGSKKKR